MSIEWEDMPDPKLPDMSNAPSYCEAGPFSHVWSIEYSYDGASMWTEECEQCNGVAQGPYGDMFEYLCGEFTVRLEQEVEVYHHPEGTETDVYIRMKPV